MKPQTRWHMQNATHMVEWPNTEGGLTAAKAFRKTSPAFKRRRIRHVIQVYPDRVPCGTVLPMT